ncbi:MAG: MEDS domain-containing protein [Acidobacteriota bacterium]
MEAVPRHQCFIYDGSPSLNVPCLGNAIRHMLSRDYRCMYLNAEPMLAEMRAYLAESGLDVDRAIRTGGLILSSDRNHLMNGRFDLKSMLAGLETALQQALSDDYAGLFATGDMSWEFGPNADFTELMDYEWQLEEFFDTHPQLSGICQYNAGRIPHDVAQQALTAHPAIFINEELSLPNPHFAHPRLAPLSGIRVSAGLG